MASRFATTSAPIAMTTRRVSGSEGESALFVWHRSDKSSVSHAVVARCAKLVLKIVQRVWSG
jgi:hypothetical protein